jgi:hypothetical protein
VGNDLGLALSIELEQALSLGRHEEATNLLRRSPLTGDLGGALKDAALVSSKTRALVLKPRIVLKEARIAACFRFASSASLYHRAASVTTSASTFSMNTSCHSANSESSESPSEGKAFWSSSG